MDLTRNDIHDILIGFGFTLLGITTVFSAYYIHKCLNKALKNFFFGNENSEDDLAVPTPVLENLVNHIDQFEITGLDISNPLNVLSFIEKHFIKDLILISNENINNNYYVLTSNDMFFQLIKKIFGDVTNRLECMKNLENSFDRLQFYLFFDKLEKSKNLDDFRKINKNSKVISLILKFLINKFNIN